MAELQKAFIGPYVNGHLKLDGGFEVPFNPSEISIEEAIGIEEISRVSGRERMTWMQSGRLMGMQYPLADSFGGHSRGLTRLSVTLFFNTLTDLFQTSYRDVREDIRQLYRYTNTTEKYAKAGAASKGRVAVTGSKTYPAEQIYFFWGTIAVAGVLKQMSVNYTLFAPDGKPVRAQVGILIEGFYVGEEAGTEKGSSAKTAEAADQKLSGGFALWREKYLGLPNPRKSLM